MDEILEILRKEDMCVLATVSEGIPHCSLMAYITDEEGPAIYMITHNNTRKYANMCANPTVSLLIDTRRQNDAAASRGDIYALTITGRYEKVEDEDLRNRLRQRFIHCHGHLREFAEDGRAVVFCVVAESFQLFRGAMDAVYKTSAE